MWNSNEVLYISNPDRTVHNYSGSISRTNTPPPRIRNLTLGYPIFFHVKISFGWVCSPSLFRKRAKFDPRHVASVSNEGRGADSSERNLHIAKFLIGRGAYVKLLLKCSFSLFHYNISFTPNKGGGKFLPSKFDFLSVYFSEYTRLPTYGTCLTTPPYW